MAAAVVLANLPFLLDLFDPNPLGPGSRLATAVRPGLLHGLPTLDMNNGIISQALGHRAALDWLHLNTPWWNPYSGDGTPLAADMQSAALFPPTILTLLANGQLYEHMLLEFLGGVCTLVLLQRLGIRRWVSVLAAIAFALNGTFAWFSHATVNPVAFLPMVLLGIESAYAAAAAGRRGGYALLAVAGALSFYAGFPEVAYIDALMAVCWLIWRCGCLRGEQRAGFLVRAGVGALIATLLAAPLLIAMIGYFNHADLELHAGTGISALHLSAHALPQLVFPYIYGPIFAFLDPDWLSLGGYLSGSLLLFSVLGVLSPRHRGLRLTLGIWIVLALTRTYHEPGFIGSWLGVLPGMSRVDFARYAFASLELPVIILAALGMEAVASAPRRRLAWGGVVAVTIMAVAAVAARPFAAQLGSDSSSAPYYAVSVAWGLATVLLAACTAFLRSNRARGLAVTALVVADTVVMFAVPELSAPRSVRIDLTPVTFLKHNLGQSRFLSLGPLAPNYGAYFGLASINVNDGVVPVHLARYIRSHLDPIVAPPLFVSRRGVGRLYFPTTPQDLLRNLPAYRAVGVAYVLEPAGQALPQSPSTFRLVFRSPSTWIYHVTGVAPYYATSPSCTASRQSVNSVTVSCLRPATLTRRVTAFPGWRASVDGRQASILGGARLFQSVKVGPGTHDVRFSYRPPGIGWGIAAFGGGCLMLSAAFVGRRPIPRSTRPAA